METLIEKFWGGVGGGMERSSLRMIEERHLTFFKLLFKAVLISEYVEFFMVQFSAFHNTLLCEPLRAH